MATHIAGRTPWELLVRAARSADFAIMPVRTWLRARAKAYRLPRLHNAHADARGAGSADASQLRIRNRALPTAAGQMPVLLSGISS